VRSSKAGVLLERVVHCDCAVKPATFGRLAAGSFAAEALFPIIHRAVGGRYFGFSHVHDVAVDLGLAVTWIASAVAGFVQRPPNAFFVMLSGTAVTLIHFVMFSVATGDHGPYGVSLPWLALFPLQAYFVVRSAPAFFERAAEPAAEPERAREEEATSRWPSLRWLGMRWRHG
jgi:hypothetical protein